MKEIIQKLINGEISAEKAEKLLKTMQMNNERILQS